MNDNAKRRAASVLKSHNCYHALIRNEMVAELGCISNDYSSDSTESGQGRLRPERYVKWIAMHTKVK